MSTATSPDTPAVAKSMDDLVALCKRRGFVFPASEIYGGLNGFWDYGPLGTQLKNNLRDAWWRALVECPPLGPDGEPLSIVGVDSSIIQNPRVWEASGHVAGFNDPMVDCRECKSRFRADHLVGVEIVFPGAAETERIRTVTGIGEPGEVVESHRKALDKLARKLGDYEVGTSVVAYEALDEAARHAFACPGCGATGGLTEPRQFNLMFKTYVGAVQDEDAVAFLRPETAQGIFTNYKNVLDTMRVKVPFGIAQIGKSFRNEVTPRNFIFRSREFEQMEMEWFCHPDSAREWYEFWVEQRTEWWISVGIAPASLQRREHDDDELAHYSTACADVEYRYPFTAPGFGELEGIAHRGCYDLAKHQEHARTKLEYFDQERNERYLPHVIEPAAGLSRGVLALLCEAYTPDPERPSGVVMRLHPRLAPIQVAVFPLVNKDGMPEIARRIYDDLRADYAVQLDVKQSIGKRYARMDEAGTPFCVTVDGDSIAAGTVTVRDRDSAAQETIAIDALRTYLAERIG